MKYRRQFNDLQSGLRFISDAEQRIQQQKQIIAQLKRKGQSTSQAEALLLAYERSLLQLRNHWDVMQELMKPDMAPVQSDPAE